MKARVEPHYGYLTMYDKDDYDMRYDHLITIHEGQLDIKKQCKMLKKAYSKFPLFLKKEMSDTAHPLIGMNSNSFIILPQLKVELLGQSFTRERDNRHNLFLERDGRGFTQTEIEEIGGMAIKTGRGMHLIREDCLTMTQLTALQKKYNCCTGFINCTQKRQYACLRICPKKNNRLTILNKPKGQFYDIYEQFVLTLHEYIK